jgi:diguanylate cyclase (GGDEF)-like protein
MCLKTWRKRPINEPLGLLNSPRPPLTDNVTNLAQTPLSDRLRSLIDTVQHNERTLRRFQDVELHLIGAQGFLSFLDTLFDRLPREFTLTTVVLWLDERAPMLHDLLAPDAPRRMSHRQLKTERHTGEAGAALCSEGRPWLGTAKEMGDVARGAFFDTDVPPASAIVLPLATGGRTTGYLCLGSDNAGRFAEGMATDILERFATIVTASLDNVAHRERLKHLGMTDPLTGLANRHYFDERLREETTRAARYALPVACLFIDIDGFKQINDIYGHPTGDRALALVGACVRQQLRLGDTLARYGGEEFSALLAGDHTDALVVAERVRHAVSMLELLDDAGARIPLTVSIGVSARTSSKRDDATNLGEALMDEADRAMYRAKRNGRNRVETLGQDA